jgi:hypothetical protein
MTSNILFDSLIEAIAIANPALMRTMTLFSACPLQVRSLVAFHGEQDICELLCCVLALPVALQLADQLDPTHRVGASPSDAVQCRAVGLWRSAPDCVNYRKDLVTFAKRIQRRKGEAGFGPW